MGKDQMVFVGHLCDVAADLIADHPQAAALLARRLGQLLHVEAGNQRNREEARDAEAAARGFSVHRAGW